MTVWFVDTSVFCNVLPVPGRDQHRGEVLGELEHKVARREPLILPVTAVIETGNFIAQLDDGGVRRRTGETFTAVLRLVIQGRAPWRLHQFEWGVDFLSRFLDGADTKASLVEHAVNKLGAGDLCVLTERQTYTLRTGLADVRIWTRDNALSGYS